jgi:hypothetical protein
MITNSKTRFGLMSPLTRRPLNKNKMTHPTYSSEYRDPVLVKDMVSSAARQSGQGAISYVTPHGVEVAVVYLHELCELEK